MNKTIKGLVYCVCVFLLIISCTTQDNQQTAKLSFMDDYEDNPTITKTTHRLWMQVIKDTKKGNYWADSAHWLEIGKVDSSGKYSIDPTLGEARVADEVAYKGNKSVEIKIFAVPSGYIAVNVGSTRYLRNPSVARDGVYEVGAWFYVPKGSNPYYVHIAMENHLSWTTGYLIHLGVNPEDSSVVVVVKREGGQIGGIFETKSIGTIDFRYETWFKLWIIYDTRNPTKYTGGYKSLTEEKLFEVDEAWTSGPEFISYSNSPGFNFYATGHNLPGRSQQKLYVDDFYAKKID